MKWNEGAASAAFFIRHISSFLVRLAGRQREKSIKQLHFPSIFFSLTDEKKRLNGKVCSLLRSSFGCFLFSFQHQLNWLLVEKRGSQTKREKDLISLIIKEIQIWNRSLIEKSSPAPCGASYYYNNAAHSKRGMGCKQSTSSATSSRTKTSAAVAELLVELLQPGGATNNFNQSQKWDWLVVGQLRPKETVQPKK